MSDMTSAQIAPLRVHSVTATELAGIAGVEASTVRKIANELFEMLDNDLRNRQVLDAGSP
jgi:hypothetical protein